MKDEVMIELGDNHTFVRGRAGSQIRHNDKHLCDCTGSFVINAMADIILDLKKKNANAKKLIRGNDYSSEHVTRFDE